MFIGWPSLRAVGENDFNQSIAQGRRFCKKKMGARSGLLSGPGHDTIKANTTKPTRRTDNMSEQVRNYPGYTVVRREESPLFHGTATTLTHDVSGATILQVENEDENKAFGIGFGT